MRTYRKLQTTACGIYRPQIHIYIYVYMYSYKLLHAVYIDRKYIYICIYVYMYIHAELPQTTNYLLRFDRMRISPQPCNMSLVFSCERCDQ